MEAMNEKSPKHIHLSGICGTAMASLAGLLREKGCRVTGSDAAAYPPMSDQLREMGIPVAQPYAAENIDSTTEMVVIGNALPAASFASAPPAVARKAGTLRVGMVARMNARYKNHSGFLRIAKRISQNTPDVEFLLAGDGPLRNELEREAQTLGIGDRVIFLGDRRDIPAVMASLDVAVLTSDSESLSNVILEAMAAGLPVVAYGVGGNPELVSSENAKLQRGELIYAGDEAGFAAAVERLLETPSMRAQFGQNARKFAEENFGLENVRSRYEECYRSLLEKKARKKE